MGSLSVAICTHNRADHLEQALASLCLAAPPRIFAWEVVVVLNGCTDSSTEIVRKFADLLPLTSVVETQQGLSHARNRASKICRGEFIVFIDDDIRVDPGFLQAYETAILKWPEADVFSGPIRPMFVGNPPNWLERSLPAVGSAFALQSVECDGAPIKLNALPYGANYTIRHAVQKQRLYNTGLGRGAVSWLRGGEETELLKAVFAGGSNGRWVASASVEHVISPERQTLAYLWRYFEGYGILIGTMERGQSQSAAGDLLELALAELAYRIWRRVAPPQHWAAAMVRAAVRRGKWKSRAMRQA